MKVEGIGDVARDLACRLFAICEQKYLAQETLAYNSLVVAWPEIAKLASGRSSSTPRQATLV